MAKEMGRPPAHTLPSTKVVAAIGETADAMIIKESNVTVLFGGIMSLMVGVVLYCQRWESLFSTYRGSLRPTCDFGILFKTIVAICPSGSVCQEYPQCFDIDQPRLAQYWLTIRSY